MNDTSKKIVKATGIAAATVGLASLSAYVSTKFLVKVALDREEPRVLKKAGNLISGTQINREFLEELEAASERLAERQCETIEILSHDGITLTGHFIPCENAERIIIAMHGWRSSWMKDFGTIADFWAENGCSVLYADQRGQNNSGGEYMGFGLVERYDVLDWINWAIEQCGKELPIYLAGVSMGATTVLMASGLELPDNVHGIAADCGFTSPHAIWKHVANNNLHIAYGLRGAVADTLFHKKLQMKSDEYSTVQALKNCKIPVLLIHGTDDHFVPIEMTYENYKACAAPKKLFVVPGADHGMSYFTDKAGYEAVIKDFWKEFDKK